MTTNLPFQFARLLAALCFALTTTFAFAEVTNPPDREKHFQPCPAYLAFLQEKPLGDSAACHKLEIFLLEHDELSPLKFLNRTIELANEKTTLGATARAQKATVWGDARAAYTWSEAAARNAAITLGRNGDVERAAFYSHLLSEIQRQAVQALCAPQSGCDELEQLVTSSELLGSNFAAWDDYRADFLLLCLLKTDAHQVPIRDLLLSPKFQTCLPS